MIQFESDHYIATHGPLEDGEVMVTSGGELAAKHVIHAVGFVSKPLLLPSFSTLESNI